MPSGFLLANTGAQSNKALTVFISSTVEDLRDARSAIRYLLRGYGIEVYASENSEFPLILHKHSYEICLQRVREADLVIALIDRRYGGIYERDADSKISITRKELRVAHAADVPIWTFVRSRTWNERQRFKKALEGYFGSSAVDPTLKEAVFNDLRQQSQFEVEDYRIFDMIDEINQFTKSDWIFNFNAVADVEETLSKQLSGFIRQKHPLILFPKGGVIGPGLISELNHKIELSGRYRQSNLRMFANLERLSHEDDPQALINFRNGANAIFDEFSDDYAKRLRSLSDTKLLVTDTAMEYLNPETWRSSSYYKRILMASMDLAKRLDLNYTAYVRVLLLQDPLSALNDSEWLKSLQFLIDFHHRTKIGLGICSKAILAMDESDTFLNFYLMPNRMVACWTPEFAMAFEITKDEAPRLVSGYEDMYSRIIRACDSETGGFWIRPNASLVDVVSNIRQLFGYNKQA